MHRRSHTFRFVTMAGRTSGETVKAPKGQMKSSAWNFQKSLRQKDREVFLFFMAYIV